MTVEKQPPVTLTLTRMISPTAEINLTLPGPGVYTYKLMAATKLLGRSTTYRGSGTASINVSGGERFFYLRDTSGACRITRACSRPRTDAGA